MYSTLKGGNVVVVELQTTTKSDTLSDLYKQGSGILVFGSGVPVLPLFFSGQTTLSHSPKFLRLTLMGQNWAYTVSIVQDRHQQLCYLKLVKYETVKYVIKDGATDISPTPVIFKFKSKGSTVSFQRIRMAMISFVLNRQSKNVSRSGQTIL